MSDGEATQETKNPIENAPAQSDQSKRSPHHAVFQNPSAHPYYSRRLAYHHRHPHHSPALSVSVRSLSYSEEQLTEKHNTTTDILNSDCFDLFNVRPSVSLKSSQVSLLSQQSNQQPPSEASSDQGYISDLTQRIARRVPNLTIKDGMYATLTGCCSFNPVISNTRNPINVNNHHLQAVFFLTPVLCSHCEDYIWGTGDQGVACDGKC